MTADIHTCSYYCERPGCIRAQRDELAARLEALTSAPQSAAAGEEIMVKTPNDVLFILPLQPSGRSIGPRFVVHVPLVEAPAVKELQAEIEALRAERDALAKVLREIAALDYKNAATNGAAYEAVQIARAALAHGGEE